MVVRTATRDDVAAIRELARTHRVDHQRYQATFWRRAGTSREEQAAYLEARLADPGLIASVHETDGEVDGAILATILPAPPVYDPGGSVALIGDVTLADGADRGATGAALLRAAESAAREKGAVLVAVVAGHDETWLRALLERERFSLASEWHRRPVDPGRPLAPAVVGIRHAEAGDLPVLLDLAERRRVQYQAYEPLFWRNAPDSREKQRPFLERALRGESTFALVHGRENQIQNQIDAFMIGNLVPAPPAFGPEQVTALVDDFCVADPAAWSDAGLALLEAASLTAHDRGASQLVVICGHRDQPKRAMLDAARFAVSSEWWVKAF